MPLPGKVINEVVAFTRQFALQDPPVEKGMYAQLDDQMSWSRVVPGIYCPPRLLTRVKP